MTNLRQLLQDTEWLYFICPRVAGFCAWRVAAVTAPDETRTGADGSEVELPDKPETKMSGYP